MKYTALPRRNGMSIAEFKKEARNRLASKHEVTRLQVFGSDVVQPIASFSELVANEIVYDAGYVVGKNNVPAQALKKTIEKSSEVAYKAFPLYPLVQYCKAVKSLYSGYASIGKRAAEMPYSKRNSFSARFAIGRFFRFRVF